MWRVIDLVVYWWFNRKKKTYSRIYDFRRGGLNICLCTGIQTLLRGHKYAYKSFFISGLFFIRLAIFTIVAINPKDEGIIP